MITETNPYSLTLCCDVCLEFRAPLGWSVQTLALNGASRAECVRVARQARWTVDWKTMTCKCPQHYHINWFDKQAMRADLAGTRKPLKIKSGHR